MSRKTLTQVRLRMAKDEVDGVRNTPALQEDYASTIEEVPILIRTVGLGPAIAFLAARNKNGGHEGSERIAEAISKWILEGFEESPLKVAGGQVGVGRLLDEIAQATPRQYRLAQSEAIEFSVWLKRLSQALLKSPDRAEANR